MTKYNRILFPAVVVAFLLSFLTECGRAPGNHELRSLDEKARKSMASLGSTSTDSLAQLLLAVADSADNDTYRAKAHFYLSNFTLGLDSSVIKSKIRHLDIADSLATKVHNDTLLAWVYNLRGIWELGQNLASATAGYWFNKSIRTASKLNQRWISIPAEMNMSEACRLSNDTLGIEYDRELFRYAVANKKLDLMWSSGLHCATYYADNSRDTAVMRPYINAINAHPKMAEGVEDMLFARFYYNNKEYDKALQYIEKADPKRYMDFGVLCAEILNKSGRYRESEEMLDETDFSTPLYANSEIKSRELSLRASNAEVMGDWRKAFEYEKEYNNLLIELEKAKVQDLTRRYKIEYEVNVKDREISEQRQRLSLMAIIITSISTVLLLIVVAFWLYNRRKNKFYQDIVRQNIDFIEKLKEYEAVKSKPKPNAEKYDAIFEKILRLVDVDQIWRDKEITRDKYAEMVGCNRTYFSSIIKEKTGKSYTQFMNGRRIQEALRVLSDPDNDTTIKDLAADLGFLTMANFHTLFKKEIGISPDAYRKTARELKAGNGTDAASSDI